MPNNATQLSTFTLCPYTGVNQHQSDYTDFCIHDSKHSRALPQLIRYHIHMRAVEEGSNPCYPKQMPCFDEVILAISMLNNLLRSYITDKSALQVYIGVRDVFFIKVNERSRKL
jgi:hypothetical protein